MGNSPYLHIDWEDNLVLMKDPPFLSRPGTPPESMVIFPIQSNNNIKINNFIRLINKIIIKFYDKKIKNLTAFILSLNHLLEIFLDSDEIHRINNIIQMKPNMDNLSEIIKAFKKLYDNSDKIKEKEIKYFIKSINTILKEDNILIQYEIITFTELLTNIFNKNINENENILNRKIYFEEEIIDNSSNSSFNSDENSSTTRVNKDEELDEKLSNSSSYNSNFSSYSKNSQNQIKKMQKEIKRLKKLVNNNNSIN